MELKLLPEEEIIYKEKISSFYLKFLYSIGILFMVLSLIKNEHFLILFAMGCSFAVYGYCLNRFTSFILTNKRLIYKTGIIGQRLTEIKVHKIESVQIYQGVMGRIFNYGDLIFSGAGNPTVNMMFMEHPEAFRYAYLESENKIKNPPL